MDNAKSLLLGCAVIALVSVPLLLKKIPPNPLYGFRTARTLANRELWFRVNCFAGWAFLLASAASAALLIALPSPSFAVLQFVGPIALALLISVGYLRRAAQ